MTQRDHPTEQDIVEALRGSGFLMEQRVATIIERLGYLVETGWPFEDPDLGASRELDVWAYRMVDHHGENDITIGVEVLCECKTGTQNPLVFLTRPKNRADENRAPLEYLFPSGTIEVSSGPPEQVGTRYHHEPAFQYLGLSDYHYYFRTTKKAVQFVKMVRDKGSQKGTWRAQHDGVFDSLFYPLAKALLARQNHFKRFIDRKDTVHTRLFFPMVVVMGELYCVDTTAPEPIPVRTEHITFVRQLDSKTVKGRFAIEFVTIAGLSEFLGSVIRPFVDRVAELAASHADQLLIRQDHRYDGARHLVLKDGTKLDPEPITPSAQEEHRRP